MIFLQVIENWNEQGLKTNLKQTLISYYLKDQGIHDSWLCRIIYTLVYYYLTAGQNVFTNSLK